MESLVISVEEAFLYGTCFGIILGSGISLITVWLAVNWRRC